MSGSYKKFVKHIIWYVCVNMKHSFKRSILFDVLETNGSRYPEIIIIAKV